MAIKNLQKKTNGGFTIFFAMLVGSLSLAIGLAIYDLTVREIDLSSAATQSQYAIYAADTGGECALYWDFKCTLGPCTTNGNANSAFATSSATATPASGVMCAGVDIAADGSTVTRNDPWVKEVSATSATTTFEIRFPSQKYCAKVSVARSNNPSRTVITSRGYNVCDTGGGVRVERVLQITY